MPDYYLSAAIGPDKSSSLQVVLVMVFPRSNIKVTNMVTLHQRRGHRAWHMMALKISVSTQPDPLKPEVRG